MPASPVTQMVPKTSALHSESVDITPELATEWLSKNDVNRRLRQGDVAKYARDISGGRWTETGEANKLSTSGRLLDGQHRLHAIVASGCTARFLVVTNVPDNAQRDMDSGIKRSAGDAFSFSGESRAQLLASSARLASIYTDGRLEKDRKTHQTSHGELFEFVEKHPELRDAVNTADHWRTAIDAPPTVISVAYFILSQVHQSQAVQFFDALATRSNLPTGSAILALDSRLRMIRKNGLLVSQREYLGLFIKAWNYWRRNKSAASLVLGGRLPEPK